MRPNRRALNEALQLPDALTPTQSVARIVEAKGSGLYICLLPESFHRVPVHTPTANTVLVELRSILRNGVFMRRGGYVLVDLAAATRNDGRNTDGEIVNVVEDEKAWRKQLYWPAAFAKRIVDADDDNDEEEESTIGKMPPSDSEDEP